MKELTYSVSEEPVKCCAFYVNDERADISDFGYTVDCGTKESIDAGAYDFCCEPCDFYPNTKLPRGIMKKYGITKKQYFEIVRYLQLNLNTSSCDMCQ